MKRVILIQYPSVSHLNASFKIAEILQKNGYEIFYFINNKIVPHAQKHHFNVYRSFTSPVVEDYDEEMMKTDNFQYSYFERFRDSIMNVIIDSRKTELINMIDELSPSIIISDTFAASDFCLIYNLLKEKNIKYFHMETMLSSTASKDIPYIDSTAFPNQNIKIFFSHFKRKFKRRLKRIYKKTMYWGYDNYSLIKKEIKSQKMSCRYIINQKNYMDITFTNIHSLLTSPIELEFFKRPQNPYQHYLGFFINDRQTAVPELENRLAEILKSGQKIIYISFGTVFGDKMSVAILAFMKKINNIAKGYNNVIFIFSLGKAKWSSKDIAALTNVYTFEFVPQTYLLEHCSLFITHGGLNSIKEAIDKSVPMLVFPLDIDQIGNSRKVVFQNIGLLGNLQKDVESKIKKKIETLLSDKKFKENVIGFKNAINQKYNLESSLISILESEGTID